MNHVDTILDRDALVAIIEQQADRIAWLEGDVAGWRIKLAAAQEENQELRERLKLACESCAECGHVDWRELDDILDGTDDGPPRAENRDAVQPTKGTGSS